VDNLRRENRYPFIPQPALGHFLSRHRQPRRPRRVLAAVRRPRATRPHRGPVGGRCIGFDMDGPAGLHRRDGPCVAYRCSATNVGAKHFVRSGRCGGRSIWLRTARSVSSADGARPTTCVDQPRIPERRGLCGSLAWLGLARDERACTRRNQMVFLPRFHARHRRLAARARFTCTTSDVSTPRMAERFTTRQTHRRPRAPRELVLLRTRSLTRLAQATQPSRRPTRLLVAQGRPSAAVAAATQTLHMPSSGTDQLHISQLPYLSQNDFDHLLWTCDFNFVRGEDSLVRALWAGRPFAWHIYPQDDLAHHDKLHAFESALDMPVDLMKFHAVWNGLETGLLPALSRTAIDDWRGWSRQTQRRLQAQTDLTPQLLSFVTQKR
jgi:hypothetical protein